MALQKVRVEGATVNVVYCPICGSKMDLSVSSKRPCKHIIFGYLDLIADFFAVEPQLKPLVKKAMELDGEDTPVEALLKLIDSKTQFCIEFFDSESPPQALVGSFYLGIDFFPQKANRKKVSKPANNKAKVK